MADKQVDAKHTTATAAAAVDTRALRNCLGRYATGVTIIACLDNAADPQNPTAGRQSAIGLTANSFAALSLDPPLVLWSLRNNSPSLPAFQAASHFVVNVLAEAQVDLSRRFASQTPDKFAEGAWSAGLGGVPVLSGCAAVFECETVSHQVAGDHVLFIGRVLRHVDAALPPLVFQSGHYHLLGEIL
jgi:flavin reductase (DIM6/NTAB) family NADH-FMN oxidoreductase RutF